MPDTVDDFLQRFGAGGTVDDEQAARFHDRFVSTRPEDNQFDNRAYHEGAVEYLGKLPDNEFHETARNAVAQVAPEQRQDLVGSLLGALTGAATGSPAGGSGAAGAMGGLAGIASMLGLGSTDPKQMSADDTARVMNYARKEQPEVLRQTVEEKPWFVKAMGNPVVMGALTMAAAKLLTDQRNKA